MSGGHLSREFFELIKNIGESRSKQEEDRIILNEMRVLKDKMKEKEVSKAKMKELCLRMIYVEMLGHDAAFGHINAINLSCVKNLVQKRVGYLACCLCLHKDHELMLLLVSTIQKDLQSDNFLEVSMALTVVCKLISAETIPVIMPLVLKLLDHANPNVRKKAIGAMNRFQELSPELVASSLTRCKKLIYDKDPSVMGASLIIVENLVSENPAAHKDLTKTLCVILKQVTEHCLSRDYDYHRIPAPWIQLKLLRILGYLGDGNKEASELIYPVLKEVMKRADIGINVGYAIVYECVRTAISIFPNRLLLTEAASSISRFLTSNNHNLKYLGINALAGIVQIDAKHAVKHQMTVIDCLEDPDDTLRRKTLDLLYSMTNPQNVRMIMQKLMTFLKSTVDTFLRTELVSKITQIAEKFAPDNEWYITTVNTVFELGGDLVRPNMVHNLINLIASEDIDPTDPDNIRVHAVDTYIGLLNKPHIPNVLLKVVAWVLGEYGHLSKQSSAESVLLSLCDAMEQIANEPESRFWLLSAALKLCTNGTGGKVPSELERLVKKFQTSADTALQQKAHEFLELLKAPATARAALPVNAFGRDEKVDSELSFLNGYVGEALNNGAPPYKPRDLNTELSQTTGGGGVERKKKAATLQFKAYSSQAPYDIPSTPADVSNTYPTMGSSVTPVNPVPSNPSVTFSNPQPSGGSTGGSVSNDASAFFSSSGPWGAGGFNAGGSSQADATKDSTSTDQSSLPATTTNTFTPSTNTSTGPSSSFLASTSNISGLSGTRSGARSSNPSSTRTRPTDPANAHKQQLAMGLFAGIGESKPEAAPQHVNKDVSYNPSPVNPQVPAKPQPQPQPQPQPNLLFEVDDTEPASNDGGAGVQTGNNAGGIDLLSLFATDNDAKGGSGDAVGVGSGGADLGGIFGGGGDGGDSKTGAIDHQPTYPKGAAGMSPKLQQQLSQFAKSTEIVAVDSGPIYVSHEKVYLPGQTLLTIFVTNASGRDATTGVTAKIKTQDGLFLRCNADPKANLKEKQDLATQTISFNSLFGRENTLTLMCGVFCRNSNALAGSNSLHVNLEMGSSTASCIVPISLQDLLRPLAMNVENFGQTWKKLGNETKTSVTGSHVSDSSDLHAVADACKLKLVKIIGKECILGAKLVTGVKNVVPCLFHTKVKGGKLFLNVRSASKELSSAGLAMLEEACR
eukprot:CAMPEP_0184491266 /NCGR_PEP_ID=MMETSP0113_2-20130426/19974_1 /TAXON_ID=91329 /ORGANISM="Norrisiella sphaerica, Strain BC52" /LENGTH=1192 /DNA_ID=CAMNT_0026875551 /DNA_START=119 /DNA_END=3697 /DNA_ORIENTATION=-